MSQAPDTKILFVRDVPSETVARLCAAAAEEGAGNSISDAVRYAITQFLKARDSEAAFSEPGPTASQSQVD